MKTIEVGIDLGTTNSAVAVAAGDDVAIVKNSLGDETTPSVIFADKNGNLVVGSKARKKLTEDAAEGQARNGQAEVKRLMGTGETIEFPNLKGKSLTPEQVSAEILIALRSDVQRKFPDVNVHAAVITVPAHFSTVQAEATKRAGHLAGFSQAVLLQEPIAAAIAYGFLNNRNENWLVYDLGGGTFDVALVAYREGGLTILAHNGDNFLGGKDLDASIVDVVIIPALKKKGIVLDAKKDSEAYQRARRLAEDAKIELTSAEKTTLDLDIEIDGKDINEAVEISRQDILTACEPLFRRTVQLCRKTISESKVAKDSISRLVLVGGPTQMGLLRDYLKSELGYKIDGSLDPLTVVAIGAAHFGRQVQIASTATNGGIKAKSVCEAKLNFSTNTSDDEQTLTGLITANGDEAPYSVSIQSESGDFSSGDLILKNGKFICQIPTGKTGNQFWIYVKSKPGNLLSCSPDSFGVSRGVSISGAPIPHSIGVSIITYSASKGFSEVQESIDTFFKRNSTLPLNEKKRYFTVRDLQVGSTDNALPIRIYEGESNIPDRNTLVCDLALTGKMVPRDIPKGSPVEIAISVDESRELTVTAYVPLIDLTLNARATIYEAAENIEEIKETLNEQHERSEKLANASPESANGIREMITEIETTIDRSSADSDQKRKAAKQVRDLKVALDEVEAQSKFEANAKLYYETVQEVADYLADQNIPSREEQLKTLGLMKNEGAAALAAKDGLALQQVIEKVKRLHTQCLFSDPAFLMALFDEAKRRNPEKAKEPGFVKLESEIQSAIKEDNLEKMRATVFAALEYIGKDHADDVLRKMKSGITR